MQQTETYKLNLIEASDTFSPKPLNENMEKLETVLSAETGTRAAADAALDSQVTALDGRVTALEAHHVAVGKYMGTGKVQFVELGFSPLFVLTTGSSSFFIDSNSEGRALTIVENGFRVNESGTINKSGLRYCYIAIA